MELGEGAELSAQLVMNEGAELKPSLELGEGAVLSPEVKVTDTLTATMTASQLAVTVEGNPFENIVTAINAETEAIKG